MKKIQLLVLLTISAFTISCGNDDDGGKAITQENIVGVYNLTFAEFSEVEVYTDPTDGTTTTTSYSDTGSNFGNSTITFNANGRYNVDLNYTITENDGGATETYQEQYIDEGVFILNTTNETLSFDGEIYNIVSFNGRDLVLVLNEVEVENDYTYTYDAELRMSK